MNLKDLEILKQKGKIKGFSEAGKVEKSNKAKYGAQKVQVGKYTFDSRKEAARYQRLKILDGLGEITCLSLQVPFELNDGGTHSLKYKCDFLYFQEGRLIVEDVKGCLTAVYRKKRRLMKQIYNIEILET